ncbi:MAG: hypothetical protein GXN93_02295, partial [Candidatus Diapherotrites archaeon]|nr:hypothetical protein [Candidatus Diapherotrites archaeon]
MQIKTKKVEFYFGRGVGMVLESLLAKAKKRVWIVSPWISEKYARALNKLADKGVDVKVVTSDDTGNYAHRRALRELIGLRKMEVSEVVHKKRDELLLAAAVIGLVGLLQIFSNWLLGVLLILAAAGMLFIYMGVDRVDYQLAPQLVPDPKIHLQIYNWGGGDEQLHSKIYIIDN